MKYKNKTITNLDIAILSQLNNVTTYGSSGMSINPILEENLDNKFIKNDDKENSIE